jgi:uncharacterized membrane protein (UPF0136 family)
LGLKVIATLVYGLMILAGGIMGYITARSVPSLISGGLLGLAAIIGGIMMWTGRSAGFVVALIATILVALFFGFQLVKGLSAGAPVGRAAAIFAVCVIEILVLALARAPVKNG